LIFLKLLHNKPIIAPLLLRSKLEISLLIFGQWLLLKASSLVALLGLNYTGIGIVLATNKLVASEFRVGPAGSGELVMAIPVLGKVMQESTMRHNHDVHLVKSTLLGQVPEVDAGVPRTALYGFGGSGPFSALAVPSGYYQTQIGLTLKLLLQLFRITARVTGQFTCLLDFWKGNDFQSALGLAGESKEAGVEGTAERRSNEVRDGGVVWECGLEIGTLLLAKRGKIWVVDSMVGGAEVMVTLGMADAVDYDFRHCQNRVSIPSTAEEKNVEMGR
jgi:hypothetical protein